MQFDAGHFGVGHFGVGQPGQLRIEAKQPGGRAFDGGEGGRVSGLRKTDGHIHVGDATVYDFEFGTRSVPGCMPTQSVGTIKIAAFGSAYKGLA